MKLCIAASGDFFSSYGGGQVYVQRLVDELLRQREALDIDLSIVSFHDTFPLVAREKSYHDAVLYEIHPRGEIGQLLQQVAPDIVHAHGEKLTLSKACEQQHIPCLVTAHHGGICCPAGTLLNTKDEICTLRANDRDCLKCYLRNIRTGSFWHPMVRKINKERYVNWGKRLKSKPFIPFLSPIGEAALSVQEKLDNWNTLKETATHFVAPSNAIADAMVRNGATRDKITVVPHGIPIPPENATPSHRKSDTIRFYYVGRICYIKGIHIMLKAFSLVDDPNIELHLIGGAVGKDEMRYQKSLQRKYRKDPRIIWHGKVAADAIPQLTKDFDALIHPTICLEIFGLDIAEALAQGHHVIATYCGGAEMQIHESIQSWLIAPNDTVALYQAIKWYLVKGNQCNEAHQIISLSEHVRTLANIYHNFTHPS